MVNEKPHEPTWRELEDLFRPDYPDYGENNKRRAQMPTAIQIGDLLYHGQCTEGVEGDRVAVEVEGETDECCATCEAPLSEGPADNEEEDVNAVEKAEAHDQVQPGGPQA